MNYTALKKWIPVFFILCSLSSSLRSQSIIIKGTIIDSTLSQPVSFVNVAIAYNRGTISDEKGNFRLPINLDDINDTLHISCIGYTEAKIPIKQLALYEQNSIYLSPNVYSLNSVSIKGKSRRVPRARRIVRYAIAQLDSVYFIDTIMYETYYREYVKQDDQYLNLFEGIINLEEFRNDSISSINTELLYKRENKDFPKDFALTKAYDNDEKFVPLATVYSKGGNELVFLRLTDPMKNVFRRTISFIDKVREDFVQHHRFSSPQLTYLDDRPYYMIKFVDNQKFMQGTNRVNFEGKIFIDAENHGIKKISYLARLDKGHIKQKLYELNVEYRPFQDKYILNYVSFNNLFMIMDFIFKDAKPSEGKLMLEFSRNVDTTSINPENFNIKYKGIEQEIEKIEIDGNKILFSFNKENQLEKDLKQLGRLFKINQFEKNIELEHQVISRLNLEFNGIYDEFQNPLSNKKYSDYYQYRELFVHRIQDGGIDSSQFDLSLPVFKNEVADKKYDIDTTWLNTPLINEDTEFRLNLSEHKLFNNYINHKSISDIKNKNEMVYLHLDREVYAPQDTLWFKGYVRDKARLAPSDLSQSFFVKLVNSEGKIEWEDKFLIGNATVKGQIPIADDLEEGIYYINGYSSWIENFEPRETFTKKILVQKEKRAKVQMMVAYDKNEYFPGDTMNIQLSCVDGYNRKIKDVRFRFKMVDGKKDIFKGNGKTDSQKENLFQVVLPDDIDSLPRIEIASNHEGIGFLNKYRMPVNYFLSVNFFPEGGHLLNGLKSRVAFKVETRFGLPVDIEGEIVNGKGEVIENIKTEHDGMGVFTLKPQQNQTYYLRLNKPGSFNEKYYLPIAQDSGMQLSVSAKNNRIIAQIENQNMENDTALLTVMIRGDLVYYKAFDSDKTKTIRIPMEKIPQGIAVFTLFDNNLLPRAERLLFVKGNKEMRAEITTDSESYSPRDSVVMKIQVIGDADFAEYGSYSLSVVDNELCSIDQIDEPGIVSYLLMSPEIKGNINNPNYYFDPDNAAAQDHLDLLMLTQGWRDYKILKKEVLDRPKEMSVNMETISGTLTKQPFGREQQLTTGFISVLFGGQTTRIPVKEDGRFSFIPEYDLQHNSGITIFAEDHKERPWLNVVLDESPFQKQFKGYLIELADSLNKTTVPLSFTYNRFDENFSYTLKNHYWIDEVVISKVANPESLERSDIATTKRVIPIEEVHSFFTLEDIREYYSYYVHYSENVVYYVNGDEATIGEIMSIQPEDILKYTIVKDMDIGIYGIPYDMIAPARTRPYVIDIQTVPFNEREGYKLYHNNVNIKRFAVAKQFYSPVYDTEQKRNSQLPDLRKTIHWDNDVKFNKEGVATIKFYNGDRYTRIKCILEGIDDRGIPIRSEYMYKVDL